MEGSTQYVLRLTQKSNFGVICVNHAACVIFEVCLVFFSYVLNSKYYMFLG